MYVKLLPYAEEITAEYQGGVGRGRSIVDQIFTVSEIPEKIREQKIYVHRLFIDFSSSK